jgi:hypothetical protein
MPRPRRQRSGLRWGHQPDVGANVGEVVSDASEALMASHRWSRVGLSLRRSSRILDLHDVSPDSLSRRSSKRRRRKHPR